MSPDPGPSPAARRLLEHLWAAKREPDRERRTVAERRRELEAVGRLQPPEDCTRRPVRPGGVPAAELAPTGSGTDPVLMFLHGGGYTRGSSASHGPLAAALAARLGGPAVVPDYRLAPEHPFPAALDDARAAWAGLTGPGGTDPARVVLAGDSAGAGLALALLQELAGAGHPGPSAALLFSPWADLRRTGPETAAAAEGDALLSPRDLALSVAAYTGGDPGLVHDPRVSPVLGSFTALPPLFVAAGGDEVLVPDALTVVAGILAAGGRAELSVTPGLCHDFVVFTTLPESVDLLDRAAAFAARALEDRTGVGT